MQKIHACPNDCILYHSEYEDLNACPLCGALHYKISRDDPGDVEGKRPRKKIPGKDVVCSYNTTVETFVPKQRACQGDVMAHRRP